MFVFVILSCLLVVMGVTLRVTPITTSVPCSLVVTCWETGDPLVLLCGGFLSFCHFPTYNGDLGPILVR